MEISFLDICDKGGIGDGRVYTSRTEAEGAMKTVKVCEGGGNVGGPVIRERGRD